MLGSQRLLLGSFFFVYCSLIVINPFPLGSNRAWAWSIEAIIACLLFILMLLSSIKYPKLINFAGLKKVKLEIWLVSFWLLVNVLYLIPLPISLLSIFAPNIASAYAELGVGYGYLSLDVYATYETLMLSLYYVLMFLVGILLVNSRKKILFILSVLLSLAVFESIYGMYLVSVGKTGFVFPTNSVSIFNAAGTFVNKNHLVAFLAMTFFSGLSLRVLINRKHQLGASNLVSKGVRFVSSPVRLLDICLLIIVAAIWNTHSRAGLVSFVLALLFYIFLKLTLLKGRKFNLKTIAVLLVSALLFLIVVADDVTLMLEKFGASKENGIEYINNDAEGRVLANKQILENYHKYWFSGVGPGAYEVFFVNHRSVEQDAFFDHAHNDYLEFLIEYGVFSLVLLAILLVVIYRLAKNSFGSKSHLSRLLGFAAISAIFYMLMHGTMDFNARIPANVVTLIVVISLLYARIFIKNSR